MEMWIYSEMFYTSILLKVGSRSRFYEKCDSCTSNHSVETPANHKCTLWKFQIYGFYFARNCDGNAAPVPLEPPCFSLLLWWPYRPCRSLCRQTVPLRCAGGLCWITWQLMCASACPRVRFCNGYGAELPQSFPKVLIQHDEGHVTAARWNSLWMPRVGARLGCYCKQSQN